MDNAKYQEILERLEIDYVDNIGLAITLEMLADICLLKAQHIKENWAGGDNNNNLTKAWESFRSKIDTCRAKLQNDANIVQGY